MPRARGDMEVGAVEPGVSVAACSQCVFTVKTYPNRIDSIPWFGPETAVSDFSGPGCALGARCGCAVIGLGSPPCDRVGV